MNCTMLFNLFSLFSWKGITWVPKEISHYPSVFTQQHKFFGIMSLDLFPSTVVVNLLSYWSSFRLRLRRIRQFLFLQKFLETFPKASLQSLGMQCRMKSQFLSKMQRMQSGWTVINVKSPCWVCPSILNKNFWCIDKVILVSR